MRLNLDRAFVLGLPILLAVLLVFTHSNPPFLGDTALVNPSIFFGASQSPEVVAPLSAIGPVPLSAIGPVLDAFNSSGYVILGAGILTVAALFVLDLSDPYYGRISASLAGLRNNLLPVSVIGFLLFIILLTNHIWVELA